MATTLVLGIGNTLLGDEGVGVRVIEYLRHSHSHTDRLELVDGGTLSFTLAPLIEDSHRLIVVDAAELGSPPGTVQVFSGEAMDLFAGNAKNSVHEVGLAELLDIARLTGRLPAYRALVAVQPRDLDWSTEPSEPVARAVGLAAAQVVELAMTWQRDSEAPAVVHR